MSVEIVHLVEPQTGATADVLASLGMNCFSWKPSFADGRRELLWAPDGYEQGDKRPTSGGIPILFPFPGRIGGAKFEFEGKSHVISSDDGNGNAIHGFVFERPWRIVDQSESAVTAEFQGSVDAPDTLSQWPSDYAIRLTYRIEPRRLVAEFEYANPGDTNLPCGLATHAYFRLPLSEGSAFDESIIAAPVDEVWRLANMVPVGDPQPIGEETPLAAGVALEGREFDTPYSISTEKLAEISGEQVVSEVRDPKSGRVVRQTCDKSFRCYVVYTPGNRQAVCIEPYTCVPDPFKLTAAGHDVGLQVLAPGESRRTTVVLEALEK